MIRLFLYFLPFCLLIFSCRDFVTRKIKGGEMRYGDTLHLSLPEAVPTFFPLYNDDIYSHRLLCNVFEPLFDVVDSNNQVQPRIAERYLWKNNNTSLILYLRKGVMFMDDPCFRSNSRELTAADVKFTLEMACSSSNLNQSSNGLIGKVIGSEEYFNGKSTSVQGITVVNPFCIEIQLTGNYSNIINLLSSSKYGICSKVAYDHYGKNILYHPVGSGPFYVKKRSNEEILLSYNPEYWKYDTYSNQLPYLNAISYKNYSNVSKELQAFEAQQLDFLFEVPTENLGSLFSAISKVKQAKPFAHKVIVIPGSRVSLLILNQKLACFSDSRVRKAFDLVINREFIATQLLNGDGIPALQGIAPSSYYYNNSMIPNRTQNIALAKQLFKEAGYGQGNPFPEMHFYAAGNNMEQVKKYCTYVAQVLGENLGVKVTLHWVDQMERLNAIRQNKASIWKLGLNPDYPDADAFFGLFYSKNPNNSNQNPLLPKIASQAYDLNYIQAIKESNNARKNNYYTNCDMILNLENWSLPLLYEDYIIIQNLRVRGASITSIGTMDLRTAYIRPLE